MPRLAPVTRATRPVRSVTAGRRRASHQLREDGVGDEDPAVGEGEPVPLEPEYARVQIPGQGPLAAVAVPGVSVGQPGLEPRPRDALGQPEPEHEPFPLDLAGGQALPALDRPAAGGEEGRVPRAGAERGEAEWTERPVGPGAQPEVLLPSPVEQVVARAKPRPGEVGDLVALESSRACALDESLE